MAPTWQAISTLISARTYQWGSSSGTSMSTPVSAGIVALWLQAARDKGRKLTSADIKEICANGW